MVKKETGHVRNSLVVKNLVRDLDGSLHLHRGRLGAYLGVGGQKSQVIFYQKSAYPPSARTTSGLRKGNGVLLK
jgi:hypothetical protein